MQPTQSIDHLGRVEESISVSNAKLTFAVAPPREDCAVFGQRLGVKAAYGCCGDAHVAQSIDHPKRTHILKIAVVELPDVTTTKK